MRGDIEHEQSRLVASSLRASAAAGAALRDGERARVYDRHGREDDCRAVQVARPQGRAQLLDTQR